MNEAFTASQRIIVVKTYDFAAYCKRGCLAWRLASGWCGRTSLASQSEKTWRSLKKSYRPSKMEVRARPREGGGRVVLGGLDPCALSEGLHEQPYECFSSRENVICQAVKLLGYSFPTRVYAAHVYLPTYILRGFGKIYSRGEGLM